MFGTSTLHHLGQQARKLGERAAQELLTRKQRAELMAAAMSGLSRGRAAVDAQGERALQALGLASRADLEALGRQVGRLRKRLEALLDRLSA